MLKFVYGSVPDTLSQLIRTAFIPSDGHKFVVADFSAIEARVIAWLAGESWRQEVFATHGKIYEASASQMFHVPIEKISNNRITGNTAEMKEPRTVLYIDVIEPVSGQRLRIAVTHLDHSTDGVRSSMVQQLNGIIGSSFPTLLAGDFNARPTESAITTGMSSWQRICNNFATFPSSAPTSKIDYIFGKPSGRWSVKTFKVLTNVKEITDHCAMLTEVQLNEM